MSRISAATYILALILMMPACRKQEETDNRQLLQKWILIEVMDHYADGGDFQWHAIAADNAQQLQFTSDGQFVKTDRWQNVVQHCSGSFLLLPQHKVRVNTTCNGEEDFSISALHSDELILDMMGTEGVIRYKYKAAK